MKSQVFDRFGGGLIVLIMLTIAVIAGQAQSDFDNAAATKESMDLAETPVAEPGDSSDR